MTAKSAEKDEKVPPNLRTFMILEVLGDSDRPLTATEINARLGLPKQTIHRLCASMEEAGLINRGADGRRYRPARRARLMAAGILAASNGQIPRHQILQEIAREAGETVNLVIQQEKGMFYLDRVETDWPFRIQLPVGTNVPFHCTASGKAFMASLDMAQRETLVESLTLEELTPNTITDRSALMAELAQIRRQGFALDDQEFFDGMVAIAVPVLDRRGRFLAAVAIHGPILRFSLDHARERRDLLMGAAERMGETLLD